MYFKYIYIISIIYINIPFLLFRSKKGYLYLLFKYIRQFKFNKVQFYVNIFLLLSNKYSIFSPPLWELEYLRHSPISAGDYPLSLHATALLRCTLACFMHAALNANRSRSHYRYYYRCYVAVRYRLYRYPLSFA